MLRGGERGVETFTPCGLRGVQRGIVVVSDLRRTAGKLELHVIDAFGQRRVAVALKL